MIENNIDIYQEQVAELIGKAGGALEKFSGNIWVIAATILGPAMISMLNKLRSQKSMYRAKLKEAKKNCKLINKDDKAAREQCIRKALLDWSKGMAATTKQELALLQQAYNKAQDDKKKKHIQARINKMKQDVAYYNALTRNLSNKSLSISAAEKQARKESKQ